MFKRYFTLAQALVLAGAVWFVYAPALGGGWVWDDPVEIPQNLILRDPSGLAKIWSGAAGVDYFPLKSSVQWVAWRLWGDAPSGYHALNLLLHFLSALLLWRILRKLGVPPAASWLGALIFAVHPMAVESVAWISELKNTLSLPLVLLALLAYLTYDNARERALMGRWSGSSRDAYPIRNSGGVESVSGRAAPPIYDKALARWYFVSVLLFVLAMLSKASVVMFPVILLLYAWWKRGRISRRDWLLSLPFFAISLALGLVAVRFQEHRAIAAGTLHTGAFLSRAGTAGLAIVFYLFHAVIPIGLEPVYPRWHPDPRGLWEALAWIGILAAALVFLGARPLRKRPSGRALALGLGFFGLNLLPAVGLVPMSFLRVSWVSDHFAYISLLGIAGLAAAGFGCWLSRCGPRGKLAVSLIAGAVIAGLAVNGRAYARAFRSEKTFWSYALDRNPSAWIAHDDLGKVLFLEGDLPAATRHFQQAVALQPAESDPRFNLGLSLAGEGLLAEAATAYRAALGLRPDFPEAQDGLGNALLRLGRPDEAAGWYRAALALRPDFPEAHANLGVALAMTGHPHEAEYEFAEALKLRPDYPEARQNLQRLRDEGTAAR